MGPVGSLGVPWGACPPGTHLTTEETRMEKPKLTSKAIHSAVGTHAHGAGSYASRPWACAEHAQAPTRKTVCTK